MNALSSNLYAVIVASTILFLWLIPTIFKGFFFFIYLCSVMTSFFFIWFWVWTDSKLNVDIWSMSLIWPFPFLSFDPFVPWLRSLLLLSRKLIVSAGLLLTDVPGRLNRAPFRFLIFYEFALSFVNIYCAFWAFVWLGGTLFFESEKYWSNS